MENKLIVPPSTAAAPGGNQGLAGAESQDSDDGELVHESHHLLLRVWYVVPAS